MRILSITAQKPHSTGSGIYLTEIMNSFRKLGYEQALVAGICSDEYHNLLSGTEFFPVYYESEALPFPIAGMSDEMPYRSTIYSQMTPEMIDMFMSEFGRAIREAVAEFKPDIILCHHLYLLTALVRENFPEICVWGMCHSTDLRQMGKNPLMREYICNNISKLDKVFCLHDEQRLEVISCYGITEDRVLTVGNGYNNRIFFNRGLRTPHEDIRLVFAGKISEKKGVFSLINSLSRLGWPKESFSLRLAGGWSNEEQLEYTKKLISQSEYNIRLLGNLSQTQLAEEFNRGDVFVLPSFYEGLPLVLAESISCGMRTVCTALPGIRSWMDKNVPNHGIIFVEPPQITNVDIPLDESLPQFQSRLAAAIRTAAAAPPPNADLSGLSWEAVCERMLQSFEK